VRALVVDPNDPNRFYFGTLDGQMYTSTDAGHNWVNVSDGQIAAGSMGAIEVSLSNPNGAFCCRAGSIAYRSRECRLVVL